MGLTRSVDIVCVYFSKEKEEINKKGKQAWQQRVRGKKLGKTVGGAL